MTSESHPSATDFTHYRPLLFSIAYRMLGTVSDAEDVLQEAFLRWHGALGDPYAVIDRPQAWLTTVVTHLCIDHLRSARVRREQYVGPWLPEPLIGTTAGGPAESAIAHESLTIAFLMVLESLAPVERAVFLLHDVFAYAFAEIAPIVDKSEANCRQIARRARAALAARRPRVRPSAAEQQRLTEQFLTACASGDLAGLIASLADDVVLHSDGGGKVNAARRPIYGADRVGRFMLGTLAKARAGLTVQRSLINNQPGIIADVGDQTIVLALDISDGRIVEIAIIVNPDKLHHLQR